MTSLDYQVRVVAEHNELKAKLKKLIAFLDSDKMQSVPLPDLILMSQQADAMYAYAAILMQRINRFKLSEEP